MIVWCLKYQVIFFLLSVLFALRWSLSIKILKKCLWFYWIKSVHFRIWKRLLTQNRKRFAVGNLTRCFFFNSIYVTRLLLNFSTREISSDNNFFSFSRENMTISWKRYSRKIFACGHQSITFFVLRAYLDQESLECSRFAEIKVIWRLFIVKRGKSIKMANMELSDFYKKKSNFPRFSPPCFAWEKKF